MKVTNEILENLLSNINHLVNRNLKTYQFAKRNGFTYIEEVKTNNTVFNYATTKKEIYVALQAFREGLYINIVWEVVKVYPIEGRTDFFKYTVQKDNILARDFDKKEIFLDDKDQAQRIADARNRIEFKK